MLQGEALPSHASSPVPQLGLLSSAMEPFLDPDDRGLNGIIV